MKFLSRGRGQNGAGAGNALDSPIKDAPPADTTLTCLKQAKETDDNPGQDEAVADIIARAQRLALEASKNVPPDAAKTKKNSKRNRRNYQKEAQYT